MVRTGPRIRIDFVEFLLLIKTVDWCFCPSIDWLIGPGNTFCYFFFVIVTCKYAIAILGVLLHISRILSWWARTREPAGNHEIRWATEMPADPARAKKQQPRSGGRSPDGAVSPGGNQSFQFKLVLLGTSDFRWQLMAKPDILFFLRYDTMILKMVTWLEGTFRMIAGDTMG